MVEYTDQSKSMKTNDVTGGILLSKFVPYRSPISIEDRPHSTSIIAIYALEINFFEINNVTKSDIYAN